MAKKTVKTETVVGAVVDTGAVANATTTTVVMYTIGKKPRNGLHEATKHGDGGTAGTYARVAAALASGPMTIDAIKELCKANGDAGFARYAVRNHWLLPAETK